jgi:predicted outer membrane repeat protein
VSTLSGDLTDVGEFLQSIHVVVCAGDPGIAGPALIGLVITGGHATGFRIEENFGGGVISLDVTCEIIDCSFLLNGANYGGGAFHGSGNLQNCSFTDNEIFGLGDGGAISIPTSASFENCSFVDNHVSVHHGGAACIFSVATCEFVNCLFESNFGDDGGAIIGNATFIGCQFLENSSNQGGAIKGSGTFIDCEFTGNDAGLGGAIHGQQLWVSGCVFSGNSADTAGGAVFGSGTIVDSVFAGNFGMGFGDAMRITSNTAFLRCTFQNNGEPNGFSTIRSEGNYLLRVIACRFFQNTGTAVRVTQGLAECVDSLFVGNQASNGAAIGGNHSAVNCTFAGNSTTGAGGAINGPGAVANCVFYENTSAGQPAVSHIAGNPDVQYSCIFPPQRNITGASNIFVDPLLVDPDGPDDIDGTEDDDLHLSADSPCINAGQNSSLPADIYDLDKDGDTNEPIPFDLDGLPRVVGTFVDMGAFEFQQVICAADIFPGSGDGEIAAGDLAELLVQWGPCDDPGNCPADIFPPSGVGDGIVGPADLAELLASWGSCR